MKIEPLFGTYDPFWYPKEHGFRDYLPEHGYDKKERWFFRGIEVSLEKTSDKIKSVLPF